MAQSNKQLIMRSFNQQLHNFGNDTIIIFPLNNDIKVAFSNLEMLKKANPSAVLKNWHKLVYEPYQSAIDTSDIDFFLRKDYVGDLNDNAKKNNAVHIIENIRTACNTLDDMNKKRIMNYLVVLSKLSVVYVNL